MFAFRPSEIEDYVDIDDDSFFGFRNKSSSVYIFGDGDGTDKGAIKDV